MADGVYAFITPEERTGFQSGNSIAIVGDDGVLVFDTGNIPGMTRRQIAEIRKLTDKPVRFVVNSHWHPDHNLGNSEYRAAFPGVTIIGTTATRAGILERVPTYVGANEELRANRLAHAAAPRDGKMRDGSAMPDERASGLGLVTRDYAEFMPEMLHTTPSPPDLVFDDSLTLMLGKRRVQIVSPGRGNTAGDTYIYLPDERVLLTGDLVTVPCRFRARRTSATGFAIWISSSRCRRRSSSPATATCSTTTSTSTWCASCSPSRAIRRATRCCAGIPLEERRSRSTSRRT